MKILAVSGSRNPRGQTAQAVEALLKGAKEAGAETELIFLPEMNIGSCRQCNENGWGTCGSEGKCVTEDDLVPVIEKMREADLVVAATPVYFGDLSESMKCLLDRVRRINCNEQARSKMEGKPAVGICVAGGGGGGSFSCSVSMERMLSTCRFDVFDIIPARRQNLQMKLPILESTGRWIAGNL